MSNLDEIGSAIEVLCNAGTPKSRITVLQCTSAYPAPIQEVNLLAMLGIRDAFDVAVGYSDHTLGFEISLAAAALGATVIEKHFTIDRNLPGPDHRISLEPEELLTMVKQIRNIEIGLGDVTKRASLSELENVQIVRKSIVAKRAIKLGEVLTEENLTTKRPGTGISPIHWDRVVGSMARRDYGMDELID
jgi:N,N'-diacetyllegionaminate synthase